VGSVGDSYDNALAETINGLYKAEVIHRRGPWRSFDAVEFATLEWVDWFNNRRLLEPIGNIRRPRPRSTTTPRWTNQLWRRDSNQTASGKPGAVHNLLTSPALETVLKGLHDSEIRFRQPAASPHGLTSAAGPRKRLSTGPSLVISRSGRRPNASQRGCTRPRCAFSLIVPMPKRTPKRRRSRRSRRN
jgi:hypothetical protein